MSATATVFDRQKKPFESSKRAWEKKDQQRSVRRDSSMIKLIEGQYEAEHIEQRRERDRQEYLESRLKKSNPRVFKNYIDNNTN